MSSPLLHVLIFVLIFAIFYICSLAIAAALSNPNRSYFHRYLHQGYIRSDRPLSP